MGKVTRKRYSADFKAKVALEAIKGDLTLAELAAKHGIHQTMIATWRHWAMSHTDEPLPRAEPRPWAPYEPAVTHWEVFPRPFPLDSVLLSDIIASHLRHGGGRAGTGG